MEILLAREELSAKPKKVKLEKLLESLQKNGEEIFYFDKENSHKDLVALVDYFEEKDFSVYLREVKYGLGEEDYMYEIHIL